MFTFPAQAVIVAKGQWGPFDDGRIIPWVDLASAEEGGVMRFTLTEGVTAESLGPILKPVTLQLQFGRKDDGKPFYRCLGLASALKAAA